MKKRIVMVLLAVAISTTVFSGCGSSSVKQDIKQEESNTKKENKDSLGSDTKKDSKSAKEEKSKHPKESTDKKEKAEQEQGKENKTETAKSESKSKETTKPSSKPTENKKPPNNPTSKPTSKPKPKPQHTHNWVAQTHKDFHEAITHTETEVIEEAWDEEVLAGEWSCCNVCGADVTGHEAEHEEQHALNYEGGGWHLEYKWETKHHPAVTKEKEVVDEEAWTETVVDGYKCSCGATK